MKQQHALYTFSENDPVNIARDFTIFSLSNGTNVHRWRQKETSNYIICQNKKTQLQSGYLTVSSLSSKQYWTTSCHNCFLYLETVLLSTAMNVLPLYLRVQDQMNQCWNVQFTISHCDSRKKLYYCNRIDMFFWKQSIEVVWLQKQQHQDINGTLL